MVKAARRVLQEAVDAVDNGLVRCCQCEEVEEGDTRELVTCDCCTRAFHVGCATGYSEGHDWWCQNCK